MLDGLPAPTLVAGSREHTPQDPGRHEFGLTAEQTRALTVRARSAGVTVNTVVRRPGHSCSPAWPAPTTWSSASPSTDARRAARHRVQVGLFINTLPLRIRLHPEQSAADLLGRVHRAQAELIAHQYLGLSEVQHRTGLGPLFDTSVVFENFPFESGPAVSDEADPLRVVGAESHAANHFPLSLSLVGMPQDALRFKLFHQRDLFDDAAAAATGERFRDTAEQVRRCGVARPSPPPTASAGPSRSVPTRPRSSPSCRCG